MADQFQLVAIKNPFDRRMRDEKMFTYDGNMSVGELIEQNLPAHVEMTVSINGEVITAAEWSTRKIRCGEQVVVVPVVHGGDGGLGSILSIALMFVAPEIAFMATGFESYAAAYYSFSGLMGVAAYGAVSMGVSLIGSALISTLTAPDSPSMPGSAASSQSFDTSPAYSWSPVTTQEPGGAIARVYGTHKVYGNIVGGYIKNSGDNGKEQTAYMLVDLGIGPIKSLSDYQINDQAITSYAGVEVVARYGNLDQTFIPAFDDTHLVRSVGQKVTKYDAGVPTSGPKTVTTTGDNFDALEVTLVFPSGLYYSNDSGGLSTQSVEVQIDISDDDGATWVSISKRPQNEVVVHGGGFWSLGYIAPIGWNDWGTTGGEYVEVSRGSNVQADHYEGEMSGAHSWSWRADGSAVWTDEVDTTIISGATTKAIRRTFRADHLTNGIHYKIRVTNLTADITTSRYGDDMIFSEYSEILYDDFQYPRSVLVAVKALATDQLSGGMKFSCMEEGSYIRVWNGSAWVSEFNNNPAWVTWDILTQPVLDNDLNVVRYDGFNPSRLDLTSFYAWAQWCDTLVPNATGGTERRCEFDGIYDTASSMWDSAMDVCRTARAQLFFKGTTVCVVYDHLRAAPAQLFTVGNTKGGFKETFLPIQDRAAALEIQYVDKDQGYIRDKITVVNTNIMESSANRTSVSLRGVARTTQAWREGGYRLARNELLLKSGEITVDIDSLACTVGDLIWIQDDVTQWGVGGRCGSGSTVSTLVLDQDVTLDVGKTYEISVRLDDDTIMTRVVTTGAGTTQSVVVSPVLSAAPELYAPWALGEVGKSIKEFLLVDVARTGNQDAVLKLAEYNASMYSLDYGVPAIPTASTSYDSTPAITNLVVEEVMFMTNNGSIQVDLIATFNAVNVTKTRAILDGMVSGDTLFNSFRFPNVVSGEAYALTLKPYNHLGQEGPASSFLTYTHTVVGKTAPPSNVTGFTAVTQPDRVVLTWPGVSDLDLDLYELREGSPWDSGAVIGRANVTSIKLLPMSAGAHTWMIKAQDTSGNYSLTEASASVTILAPSAPSVIAAVSAGNLSLTWGSALTSFAIDNYEVRYGTTATSFAAATSLGSVTAQAFSVAAQWSGTRRYWVRGTDIAGNIGAESYVDVTIALPVMLDLRQQVVDNNVLLYWNANPGSLPIDTYELRKGATWSGVGTEVIGTKSGGFTSVFELIAGTYTYWVAPIDVAGNYGAEWSIGATVSQPPDYVLLDDRTVTTFVGTLTNALAVDTALLMPVNTTETWTQHFVNNGWASPQAQISAGFQLYIEPSSASGSYAHEIDYGAIIASTKITVTITGLIITGAPDVECTISTKLNFGDAWTDNVGVTQLFASNFRYVKVTVGVTSSGGDDLYELDAINVRLDVKLKNDAGMIACVSSDSGGTVVNFNSDFLDISSIVLTPAGTTLSVPVYDFHNLHDAVTYSVVSNLCTVTHNSHPFKTGMKVRITPSTGGGVAGTYVVTSTGANTYTAAMVCANTSGNAEDYPQGFLALLFDASGARQTRTASWSVKGY